jgi:chromosome segregation ATPase
MTSQQVEMRGQEQVIQVWISMVPHRHSTNTLKTRRPERIDTSGRALPSNTRESVRSQPQLLSRQAIDALNHKLLGVGQTIETTRQRLYETRFIADTAQQELEQERHIRQQCSDAYKEVHVQYGKKAAEAHEMATKCMSLHNELEESRITISNYESAFKQFENSIASRKLQLEDTAKDLERRTSELQIAMKTIQELEKEVNNATARECLAKKTVSELEEERARLNLALQRFDGMEEEEKQLGLALQKIHNLEKEKEDTAQKHWARMNEMIAREALAEQKIAEQRQEVEELIRELQAATTITMDRLNSAEVNPGMKHAANPARVRPSKYRKCKDARKVANEDTIEVRS